MYTKYLEHGLGVIPLNGKAPFFIGWQQFCERLPSPKEAEEWEIKYGVHNIGLPCGPASGILAVDIDSTDEILASLIPPSPLVKVGNRERKFGTRFFRYNPDVKTEALHRYVGGVKDAAPSIEVLSLGRQTVLPDSVHPESNLKYIWLTKDHLLGFPVDHLPSITSEDLEPARAYLMGDTQEVSKKISTLVNDDPSRKSPHGAQAQLKTICAAIISEGLSADAAIERLLSEDRRLHKPCGYFEEMGRTGDQRADPYTNALHFYSSNLRSHNEKRMRSGLAPEVPGKEIDVTGLIKASASVEVDLTKFKSQQVEKIEYPEGRGLLKEIQDYIQMVSPCDTRIVALGGAIATMGTIVSNRCQSEFSAYTVTPNIYILNLMDSGGGKDEPIKFARSCLKKYGLLGSAAYVSQQSIVQDLPKQQERCDVIDEATSLLKLSGSTKGYESGVADILTQLFSSAKDSFDGISSKNGGSNQYACHRPHLSIFGSTTPMGFKECVNRTMTLKGLMPRFLIFYQKDRGLFRRPQDRSLSKPCLAGIEEMISNIVKSAPKCLKGDESPINLVADSMGFEYSPKFIPFSPAAIDLFFDFSSDIFNGSSEDGESTEAALKTRGGEIVAKLALIDALASFRGSVELDSLEWAIRLVQAQWHASRELYEEVNVENEVQAYAQRILKKVTKFQEANMGAAIGHKYLFDCVRATSRWVRDAAMSHLLETEKLFKKPHHYSISPFKE